MKNKTPSLQTKLRHAFASISGREPICSKVYNSRASGSRWLNGLAWMEAVPVGKDKTLFNLFECQDSLGGNSFTGKKERKRVETVVCDNAGLPLYVSRLEAVQRIRAYEMQKETEVQSKGRHLHKTVYWTENTAYQPFARFQLKG